MCFQDFTEELAGLPGLYAAPHGRLYLAMDRDEVTAGCIGLRPLNEWRAEIKRLYVRPNHRGQHLGRELAQRVIGDARDIGYREVVLDTLPSMTAALALYRSLGFRECPAYTDAPVPGALSFNLRLP